MTTWPDNNTASNPAAPGRRLILWQLFISFARVGTFMFGGGYAMLPLLEREAIDRRGWADRDEILDIYGMAQVVPGVIGVNTATFLGQRQAGYLGALAATAGMIAPSIIAILLVAVFLGRVEDNPVVVAAFKGIRAGVGGLIVATAWRIVGNACKNRRAVLLMLLAASVTFLVRGGAVWVILATIMLGITRHLITSRFSRKATP